VPETEEVRGEKSRLKGGCSQDWLPHKGSIAAIVTALGWPGPEGTPNRPDPEGTPANLPHNALHA
jgi:hypothetical protein